MNERDKHNDQILIKMSIGNKVIAIRHSNKLPFEIERYKIVQV